MIDSFQASGLSLFVCFSVQVWEMTGFHYNPWIQNLKSADSDFEISWFPSKYVDFIKNSWIPE